MKNTLNYNKIVRSNKSNPQHNSNPISYTKKRISKKTNIINFRLFKYAFILFLAVFICVAGILNISAEGSTMPVQIQYKSIQIENGDTLWNIATEYNDEALSNSSTSEYVDDILRINNLKRDDLITAGNYIVIPIYAVAEH